jgi:hypothetical protein
MDRLYVSMDFDQYVADDFIDMVDRLGMAAAEVALLVKTFKSLPVYEQVELNGIEWNAVSYDTIEFPNLTDDERVLLSLADDLVPDSNGDQPVASPHP